MAATKPFVSKEMKDISKKIKETMAEQKKLKKEIRTHAQQVIDGKFAEGLLTKLAELEKKEVELATTHANLRQSYLEATQKERRERFQEAQAKQGVTLDWNSSSIFSNSLRTSMDDVSSKVLGKSSRAALRSRTANPFLEGSGSGSQEGALNLAHDITTWELKYDEITFSDVKLGQGSYGSVCQGKLRGKTVAIKTIMPKWEEDQVEGILEDFKNECAVMSKLLHPNVLLLMGVCIDKPSDKELRLIMVTEFMSRGSVFDLLHKDPKKKVLFKQRMKFAKDACLGMNWLHLSKPPILHLDLKTQNLLVDGNWVAKVADFGLSRVKQGEKNKGATGSPVYMAPEVLANKPYDEKADVYSYGIVLWELLTGSRPYVDEKFESLDEIYEHVVIDAKRPKIPPECPPELAKLIQRCWDADPTKRPSFQEILESHILDEVIVDAIITKSNAEGRVFWKQCFTEKEEILETVPWHKFLQNLVDFCNLNFPKDKPLDELIEIKSLKIVLVGTLSAREEFVTIENFSRILEWFGPFTRDTKFLETIQDTISMNGFFGDISSTDAEQVMAGKKAGQYMIRFSSQQPGYYTITAMAPDNTLKHYRIKHKAGLGFLLGNQEYPSLAKLLKAHRKDLGLKRAVKGSKYSQLFVAHDEQNESAYVEMMV
jgi:serine/threonine protein kinase